VRLGQATSVTDTGRKRRHNEDSYVCDPPIFAIADGVGGAQAGEVASSLAASALREGDGQGDPEDQVVELIQEANRRIFERSGEDSSLSGMGTTITVALVDDAHVTFGHVGDSRAYLVRNGQLDQLTDDHSLVAELTRAGKISEEEAEIHPQRSVITRAVGTDPDVDVDTFVIEPQPNDVFLLCSDGLTDMVSDEDILRIVDRSRDDLKAAAKDLVFAANKAGGEDNITVVVFEVKEGELEETKEQAAPPSSEEDDQDTLSGLERVPVVSASDAWTEETPAPRAADKRSAARRRPSRRLMVVGALVLLLCAAIGIGLFGLSQSHFVGAQGDGHVAVYQGVPWDLGAGVHLYRVVYVSPLLVSELTQRERKQLFNHSLRSFSSARDAVRKYETEAVP
jgi:PPM family protein phosphatase